ncbi:MAG TPA: Rieske 2Fe-2S domain-containing protein [Chloroflexota bacterium]|nr:Rieske 2Fe-2S domain-containing protein [Chloroflexota bacterium]
MLSTEENALLTRTGPGTPMGELFRRFWLPALLSEELPNSDCPPIRLRLLCEDLVAFRDSTGRVGILGAHCPHRGASLFFGRNEERGLRCVYHGWKFDADGHCVDMPNEPPESNFKDKVHAPSYPTRERAGLIWIYMGPADRRPSLPELEWARVPDDHRLVAKWLQETNYLQGFEGDIDTSHASFLHTYLDPSQSPGDRTIRPDLKAADRAPKIIVDQTDYGFRYGAKRRVGDGTFNWRITQWLMPTYSLIGFIDFPANGRCWIPIDDEHTWTFFFHFHPERPLTEKERASFASGRAFPPHLIPGTYRPLRNRENEYMLDRELQRTSTYTGIYGVNDQDRAIQESMGAIYDRTQEHLATADTAVIAARRRLIQAVRDLQRGIEPYPASHGDLYHVRALDAVTNHDDMRALLADFGDRVVASV